MVAKHDYRDDARLTAYALGELDESERSSVEELLAGNADARQFVEELRATAQELEQELTNEPALELTAQQRDAIIGKAVLSRRARTLRLVSWAVPLVAIAAGIAVILSVFMKMKTDGKFERMARAPLASPMSEQVTANGSPPELTALQVDKEAMQEALEDAYVGDIADSADPLSVDRSSVPIDALQGGQTGGTPIGVGRVGHIGAGATAFATRRAGGRGKPSGVPASGFFYEEGSNTEAYDSTPENAFKLSRDDALSTFSIDVDTASYSNVRRFLNQGQLPPPGAVRIEELVNYFRYAYPPASGADPFSTSTEVAKCPWRRDHLLVRIGLRGRDIQVNERPASNLVFLIDVSGSMQQANKLPLVVRSMKLLVEQLDARDRIAMVVYAGSSGLVLPSTSCGNKAAIVAALDALEAGGSTNGGAGIELAYKTARENMLEDGTNRVILCTDGDFNVGTTSQDELVRLIEEERKSGVFLSVLGFGTGNTKDSTMEKLADKGNGNYGYIDTINEARKVMVEEIGATLVTIAKDVKIQVEFNPALVQAWRLIGYENRVLAHQDFNDDKKDAGEIGAGTTVTALYELVPVGVPFTAPAVDPLRYQQPGEPTGTAFGDELMFVKLRYKEPTGDTSKLLQTPLKNSSVDFANASEDFRFAAAVAAFGMKLRQSKTIGDLSLVEIARMATTSRGRDETGYRTEFLGLVERAAQLDVPAATSARQESSSNQQTTDQQATNQPATGAGDTRRAVESIDPRIDELAKLEAEVSGADSATSEKLKAVRQQLTELEPKMAIAASDVVARYEIARASADKAYADKLLDEAKNSADNEPENRGTLIRCQIAEDEIKALLDASFRARNSDVSAFYEQRYRRAIELSDQVVTRQFTPEAQEKLPWIDCLSGAKANEWTASKAKGFSHRCEGGALQLVGPDLGEQQEAVISIGDREQWRSVIVDLEFTIVAGPGADLCLRLGKNVNVNTLFQPLKTDRPSGPSLVVGTTYRAKLRLVGSNYILQYAGDGADNNTVFDIEWPKSRKGAIGLIVPPGTRMKFTKFLVRNLN